MSKNKDRETASTLVIQSFKSGEIPAWINTCLDSVRLWAKKSNFDYEFVDDEIFDLLPKNYRQIADKRVPILTDLGRLLLIRRAISGAYRTAIWVDADVLVFDPALLSIPLGVGHAFCREMWVQNDPNKKGSFRVYKNVHNAVCLFERGDAFLNFYVYACERIVTASQGLVPNQIVGTKFLTALHNIVAFPLINSVGMLSPVVLRDIASGGGEAIDCLIAELPDPLAAVNLCMSLVGGTGEGVQLSDQRMELICDRLMAQGLTSKLAAK